MLICVLVSDGQLGNGIRKRVCARGADMLRANMNMRSHLVFQAEGPLSVK